MRNDRVNAVTGKPILVKVMSRYPEHILRRQLPDSTPTWSKCEFIFDPEVRRYDWLVVYDDLPAIAGERRTLREEFLACPKAHTMLVTTEPSSIKTYGNAYTAQFGLVLTSQEEWALPHPDRIYSQPALRWFYGVGSNGARPLDQMRSESPCEKKDKVSLVWSEKAQRHTLHNKRFEFMREIRTKLRDLDVFGGSVCPLDDKAEAIDNYKYHIAVENHIALHHWTEKLADSFLGFSLPLYCGCPNVTDYFPADSVITIDIDDVDGTVRKIIEAIRNNEYDKRLSSIKEARRRVLEKYNFFAVISREIESRHPREPLDEPASSILSRYALRKKYPLLRFQQLYEKSRVRILNVLR